MKKTTILLIFLIGIPLLCLAQTKTPTYQFSAILDSIFCQNGLSKYNDDQKYLFIVRDNLVSRSLNNIIIYANSKKCSCYEIYSDRQIKIVSNKLKEFSFGHIILFRELRVKWNEIVMIFETSRLNYDMFKKFGFRWSSYDSRYSITLSKVDKTWHIKEIQISGF